MGLRDARRVQVGGGHVGRQGEAVAQVPQPPPHPGDVHGDDERRAARLLGPYHQLGRGPAVAQAVQLEPGDTAERGDGLDGPTAQHGQGERDPGRRRGPSGRQLAVLVRELLIRHRGDRDRHGGGRRAGQLGLGVAARGPGQHPGYEPDPVQGRPVGREGLLAAAAARDEVPDLGGQHPLGDGREVRDGHRRRADRGARRRAGLSAPRRAAHRDPPVEPSAPAELSDPAGSMGSSGPSDASRSASTASYRALMLPLPNVRAPNRSITS